MQRCEQLEDRREPTAHRLARDPHPLPLEHLFLPVQRLMIREFADDHMRQHTRSSRTLLNRLRGLVCCPHRAIASVLPAHVLDYLNRRWNVLVAFTALFGDQPQIFAAAVAMLLTFRQIMHNPFPDQVLWQSMSPATLVR